VIFTNKEEEEGEEENDSDSDSFQLLVNVAQNEEDEDDEEEEEDRFANLEMPSFEMICETQIPEEEETLQKPVEETVETSEKEPLPLQEEKEEKEVPKVKLVLPRPQELFTRDNLSTRERTEIRKSRIAAMSTIELSDGYASPKDLDRWNRMLERLGGPSNGTSKW
jgi:hypothetical protein